MPIQTPAFKLVCSSCGWNKVFTPISDVRLPGQVPDNCPNCESERLEHTALSVLDKLKLLVKI